MIRTRYVAILSLLFTIVFFIEYMPPFRRAHIPFDLEGFHYPLADYAFQAIRQGRFPQWDPTIYCGLSFAGNIQAALFYPPAWLMFAFNWGRSRLSYQSLQDLTLAHVWLAFLLCYVWLRNQRGLHPLASTLGGGVLAFSGYVLLQLQHFGLVSGYTWIPLGFSGIDAAAQKRSGRPLWKLTVASAMCFLAGYPPTWIVFAVSMIAYACGRKGALRSGLWTAVALAASLGLVSVQFMPAWEAARMKEPEERYNLASGITNPEFFISYLAPNYFDFALDVAPHTNPGREYLYLGAPGLAGLGFVLWRRRFSTAGPMLAVLIASIVFLTNPFAAPARLVEHSSLLAQVFSDWYFLAGLHAGIAALAAVGLDSALRRKSGPAPTWIEGAAIVLSLAWTVRLIAVWIGGGRFAVGWRSAVDALMAAILFGALILVFPRSAGRSRAAIAAAALLLAGADYKVFGTSKRFNANRGPFSANYAAPVFPGVDTSVYEKLRGHPEYRVALDLTGPSPVNLRHVGLATPQGFDPLLPTQYKVLIGRIARFRTNREFDLYPEDEEALRLLGVRFFISSESGPLYSRLLSNPHFQLLRPAGNSYKVFEYVGARPAFGWEEPDTGHTAELILWLPEGRCFAVRSTAGGQFRLTEQFYPGWTATVDQKQTTIVRCHEAFQCITIPPGEHVVEFRYRLYVSLINLALGRW